MFFTTCVVCLSPLPPPAPRPNPPPLLPSLPRSLPLSSPIFSLPLAGILRGNKHAPYSFSRPFKSGDPRLPAALPHCEPRIHFALNCGAHSCPPVKTFTSAAVREELRVVAMAFCEQDENVLIDIERKTIHVSKIFGWYSSDFGSNSAELVASVGSWLRGEKKAALERLILQKYSVRRFRYDWTTNAKPTGKVFGGKNGAAGGGGGAGKCVIA